MTPQSIISSRPPRTGLREQRCRHVAASLAEALDDPRGLDVELLLSTHLSVVVRARLEGPAGGDAQEVSLVIARPACIGDRPAGAALLAAAQQFIDRSGVSASQVPGLPGPGPACRLLVCIAGRWQCLIDDHPAASPRKDLQ